MIAKNLPEGTHVRVIDHVYSLATVTMRTMIGETGTLLDGKDSYLTARGLVYRIEFDSPGLNQMQTLEMTGNTADGLLWHWHPDDLELVEGGANNG